MDASAAGKAFFDSNFLVYLFDVQDQDKQKRAQAVWQAIPADSIVLSTQVLSEFYWTVTRKLRTPLSAAEARSVIERLSTFSVVAVDGELVQSAVALTEATSIAYWDALVVAAARRAGCHRLLTEDLNHGQVIDGIRVENPFLA